MLLLKITRILVIIQSINFSLFLWYFVTKVNYTDSDWKSFLLPDWKDDPWYESYVELMVILNLTPSFTNLYLQCKLEGRWWIHWKDWEPASSTMGSELWPGNWWRETGKNCLWVFYNEDKIQINWPFTQITFNVYQYNTRLQTIRLAGYCQIYGIYIMAALK